MRKPLPHAPSLMVAAPASGSGKTTLTLGLIAAFVQKGARVRSFKIGPDYIDPAFHAAASGQPCPNLDPWAMRGSTLDALMAELSADAELLIGEGVMGLFDGAPDGTGSSADIAARFGLPVILVIDACRQGASVAALAQGFAHHRGDVTIAGVVLNRVGSPNHEAMLRRALNAADIHVFGALSRDEALALPSRHLGLVQAREHAALNDFVAHAADVVAHHVDLEALRRIAAPPRLGAEAGLRGVTPSPTLLSQGRGGTKWSAHQNPVPSPLAGEGQGGGSHERRLASIAIVPLGQRIAIARDDAFTFLYPHVLDGWRRAGAEIAFFSPLADDAPAAACDAVYLPGGYPELHAGQLSAATRFMSGLRNAAARGTAIYGECGGYMTLGDGLIGADGARHTMAGLLPLETSFAERKLHLGYRTLELAADSPLGATGTRFKGHEFHYATIVTEGPGDALFNARDASGTSLGAIGRRVGAVLGSFAHLVDLA